MLWCVRGTHTPNRIAGVHESALPEASARSSHPCHTRQLCKRRHAVVHKHQRTDDKCMAHWCRCCRAPCSDTDIMERACATCLTEKRVACPQLPPAFCMLEHGGVGTSGPVRLSAIHDVMSGVLASSSSAAVDCVLSAHGHHACQWRCHLQPECRAATCLTDSGARARAYNVALCWHISISMHTARCAAALSSRRSVRNTARACECLSRCDRTAASWRKTLCRLRPQG